MVVQGTGPEPVSLCLCCGWLAALCLQYLGAAVSSKYSELVRWLVLRTDQKPAPLSLAAVRMAGPESRQGTASVGVC